MLKALRSATPILILEDSVVTSLAVGRILEQAVPDCHIVRAQSCFEAQLLLRIYDFQLAVLDVNLPDGSGLDLVPTILSCRPGAGIIVMTADPLPEHRQRSRHLGVHHFIPKPFEAETLREAARRSMGSSPQHLKPARFNASLKDVSLFDIVQLKCLTRASCRLEVSTADPELRIGTLDFDRGEVVHAEVRDASLQQLADGEDALHEIFSWKRGNIEDSATRTSPPHTIEVPWQALLLDAAQRTDETLATSNCAPRPNTSRACRPAPPQSGQTSFVPRAHTDPRCPASPIGKE